MFREYSTGKWVIGGFLLLLIFAGLCALWLQHETAKIQKEEAANIELRRQLIQSEKADTDSKTEQAGNTFVESTTPTAEKPITETTLVTKKIELTHAQTETESLAENAAADVRVSPFGFGPYPEIPEGLNYTPFWNRPPPTKRSLTHEDAIKFELMSRVWIKLWEDGIRDVTGMGWAYGKLYPNRPGIAYVWYEDEEVFPGVFKKSISRIKGLDIDPTAMLAQSETMGESPSFENLIPDNYKVLDGETEGIEPYTYLGLSKQ